MTNLDYLERLSRLHSTGALTDEEYEREKARALAPSRKPFLVGAGIVAIVAVGGASYAVLQAPNLQVAGSPRETSRAETLQAAAPPDAASASELPAETRPAAKSYAWAASTEMVGKNAEWLRAQLGPAETTDDASWSYTIDGCSVLYRLDKSRIDSLSAQVSSTCRPTVWGKPVSASDTFAKYANSSGVLAVSCLHGCGNAADPTAMLAVPGSRSTLLLDVVYSSIDFDGEAWTADIARRAGAADAWEADPDLFLGVCDPPPAVTRRLAATRIDNVEIGYGLADRSKLCRA